jgi:hypothetical protein
MKTMKTEKGFLFSAEQRFVHKIPGPKETAAGLASGGWHLKEGLDQ